jgi:hypothetical protein
MMNINTYLLSAFIRLRLINGIPTRREIVDRILKTSTRSVFPEGWEFR